MFACPAQTNVPEYIGAITKEQFDHSYFINQAKNLFPGSLGRVCTRPCEDACRHGYEGYGDPVSICRLKRSGDDYKKKNLSPIKKESKTGKTVAIVGAGPTGLAAARDLLLLGHKVTLFEASDQLGGMLSLAIPEFRLPRSVIEDDLAHVLALEPTLRLNTTLGKDITLNALLKDFDATLLALGCQKPIQMRIPGESLANVYHGLDFVIAVNQGKKPNVGNRALVIGGGYTAVDCARMLRRLGVEKVTVAYRRTPKEISIDKEEIDHLELEEVEMKYLTTVTALISDDDNRLNKVELARTKLQSNRVTILEESKYHREFDSVFICIGQSPQSKPFITPSFANYFDKEWLTTDSKSGMTKRKGLFGAGDYTNGTRSIIDAVADGRKVAQSINSFLRKAAPQPPVVSIRATTNSKRKRSYDFIPKTVEQTTPFDGKITLKKEVNKGFTTKESTTESLRCYLCNLHYEINIENCIYCMRCIDEAPIDCIKQIKSLSDYKEGKQTYVEAETWDEIAMIYIDNNKCVRCGKCLDVCPTRCISVSKYTLVDPLFGEKA